MKLTILLTFVILGFASASLLSKLELSLKEIKVQDDQDLQRYQGDLAMIEGFFSSVQNSEEVNKKQVLPQRFKQVPVKAVAAKDDGQILPKVVVQQKAALPLLNIVKAQPQVAKLNAKEDDATETATPVPVEEEAAEAQAESATASKAKSTTSQVAPTFTYTQDSVNEVSSNEAPFTVKDPTVTGPTGVACTSVADCNQKNQDFYIHIKKRLLGQNGADGEQGAPGPKGLLGAQGDQGPAGVDGVAANGPYLQQLAQEIAQSELLKTVQDASVDINMVDNAVVLEEIYYGPVNNCQAQRASYFTVCNADLIEENCNANAICCPSLLCAQAIDALQCCFQNNAAPITDVEKWDLEQGQSWMDMLVNIAARQTPKIGFVPTDPQQHQIFDTIIDRFNQRTQICSAQGYSYTQTCPFPGQQQNMVLGF